jgi:SET domain-containing protein
MNWCQNNEKFIHKSKLTRIGKSNILNAGLGLFAGEPIFKGEFVMKYFGEFIDSESL